MQTAKDAKSAKGSRRPSGALKKNAKKQKKS